MSHHASKGKEKPRDSHDTVEKVRESLVVLDEVILVTPIVVGVAVVVFP